MKARRVSEAARDLAEWLPAEVSRLPVQSAPAPGQRLAFHAPCSLQHGQQVRGAVESLLAALGAEVVPVAEPHLCCGSAGTYSVLQQDLSQPLRDRKIGALTAARPEVILSANIGCIVHLAAKSPVPVRHWIEWLDERLAVT
jgi:glycolate oxidase iron-sulfur subunit